VTIPNFYSYMVINEAGRLVTHTQTYILIVIL
jgi:hypothetical protein